MREKWWETYEWGRIDRGRCLHARLLDAPRYTLCGMNVIRWDSAADLPRCKSCERSIAATVKR